jgi:hypothetical protein
MRFFVRRFIQGSSEKRNGLVVAADKASKAMIELEKIRK